MVGKVPNLEPQSSGLRLPKGVRQYWSPFFKRWITKKTPERQQVASPYRKQAMLNFKNAQQLIRQVSAEDWQAATDMSKNTPFLTRDLLMKNAYGNLMRARTSDGLEWQGVGVLNANIQQLLNSITTIDNTIICRIGGYWVALLPGESKDVLTIDETTGQPRWLPAQGGGGGSGEPFVFNIGPAGNGTVVPYDSVGQIFRPHLDMTMTAVNLDTNYTTGRTYQIGLAPYDRGTDKMTAAPSYSDPWTATANGRNNQRWVLPHPFDMSAGQDYIIFMLLVSGTGTTGTTMQYASAAFSAPGFYIETDTPRTLASNNPTISDTWARHGNTGIWGFQLEYLIPS